VRTLDQTQKWVVRGVATAVYAGAITAAAIERNDSTGRGIATAAGVPMGAAIGMIVLDCVAVFAVDDGHPKIGSHTTGEKLIIATAALGGAVAGGVIGARLSHSAAASPDARAPVTALALAPTYISIVGATFLY
jgi:threonine/homoserine efflux transporter RhtA